MHDTSATPAHYFKPSLISPIVKQGEPRRQLARTFEVMLASVEPRPSRRASTSSLATSSGPTALVRNTLQRVHQLDQGAACCHSSTIMRVYAHAYYQPAAAAWGTLASRAQLTPKQRQTAPCVWHAGQCVWHAGHARSCGMGDTEATDCAQ